MKYISGIYALNISCSLETSGDWHVSSLNWEKPLYLESDDSPFGNYGIEHNKKIPEHDELFSVANHIRACLDLIYSGQFGYASGMNENYISNSKYDDEIFKLVLSILNSTNSKKINDFMLKEYRMKWFNYLKLNNINYNNYKELKSSNIEDTINKVGIDKLIRKRLIDLNQKNDIDDLIDVMYIINNHWDNLNNYIKDSIIDSINYKGIEFYQMIIENECSDELKRKELLDELTDVFNRVNVFNEYGNYEKYFVK